MLMEVEEQAKTASEILLFVVDEKTRGVASMVEIGYLLGTRTITPVPGGPARAKRNTPPRPLSTVRLFAEAPRAIHERGDSSGRQRACCERRHDRARVSGVLVRRSWPRGGRGRERFHERLYDRGPAPVQTGDR